MIKKLLPVIAGAAMALSASGLSALAEYIEIETDKAETTSDGISCVLPQDKFSAAQITNETSITVKYEGGEDSAESPVKLMLTYWNSESEANGGAGEPAVCEVIPSAFGDGEATADYKDLLKGIGSADFSPVMEIAVAANGAEITCKSVTANNAAARDDVKDSTNPVAFDVSAAKDSSNWSQSVSYDFNVFDASRMTTSSKVIVNFECDEEEPESSPVELIIQSWEDPDTPMNDGGNVWAKVAPADFGDGWAVFNYVDMIEAYGSADFSKVSAINVGDTGTFTIKCTGMYITNCKLVGSHVIPEDEDASSESEDASAAEESVAESAPETTTTAAAAPAPEETTAASAAESSSSSGSNVIFVVIGVVAGIVLAVAVLFIILGRKSKESYDVESHQFVKKK